MQKIIWICILSFLLQACVNPPYKFTADEKTAKLRVLHNSNVSMCAQGKVYDLKKLPKNNVYLVPVGKRVDLSTTLVQHGYNVTYTCTAYLSFVPTEGKSYLMDASAIGNRCTLDLVQEDPSTETGLAPELSTGAPTCFAVR